MIQTNITLEEGQLTTLMEVQHLSELKRAGIPLRGNSLIGGVEVGSLTFADRNGVRTYIWQSEPIKVPRSWFSKRFRVRRINTVGETWFEVQEWKWYWPMWDTWTCCSAYDAPPTPIRYNSLYIAKEAVRFYQRHQEPVSAIVDRL